MFQKLGKKSTRFWLACILILGLGLRLLFFVGYTNTMLDEGIYENTARWAYNKPSEFFPEIYKPYKRVRHSELVNPAGSFLLRPMMVYPVYVMYAILGVNKLSVILWPLLCSLGSIFVVYLICKEVFDEWAGLIAGFLFSIYPASIIYATRLEVDFIVSFFMAISVLFFVRGTREKGGETNYLLSGVFIGLSYMTKISGLLLLPTYFFYIIFRRKFLKQYLFIIMGFGIVFLIEGLFYHHTVDNFFLHSEYMKKNALNIIKERIDGGIAVPYKISILRLYEYDIEKWYYLKILTRFEEGGTLCCQPSHGYPVVSFFYYTLFLSIGYALLRIIRNGDYRVSFPIIWLLLMYLSLEFSPRVYWLDSIEEGTIINVVRVWKNIRYSAILVAPAIITISYSLVEIWRNARPVWPRNITHFLIVILILILTSTSFYFTSKSRVAVRDGIDDIRAVNEFLRTQPKKEVFVDNLAFSELIVLSGDVLTDRLRDIKVSDPYKIKDAYVVIGGARGGIVPNSIAYPRWVLENRIPSNWKIVFEREGNKKVWIRKDNVRIYYAPGD